jgi:hypothetical protein
VTEQYDPNNNFASRRSSYFGGKFQPQSSYMRDTRRRSVANVLSAGNDGPRPPMGGGYYGNQQRDSYVGPSGPGRMRYGNRMQSDGAIAYGRPYPQHMPHTSQDTMNTGVTNGSDSTGPWANSTDPSSENSSIENNAMGKQPAFGYGQVPPNGYPNSPPIMEEQGQNGYGYGGPVQAPNPSQSAAPRRPIPLGNSSDAPPPPPGKLPSTARQEPEKKKGWLKRRFSKNN